jgi:hypothetical protein
MTKKDIAQEEFDRKLKLLSIIVPVITCIISVIIAPWLLMYSAHSNQTVAVTPSPTPGYQISKEDQLQLQIIQAKFPVALSYYNNKSDPIRSQEANRELTVLANEEAAIMRKYVPDWPPRWPVNQTAAMGMGNVNITVVPVLPLILLFIVLYFGLRPVFRWILQKRYSVTNENK